MKESIGTLTMIAGGFSGMAAVDSAAQAARLDSNQVELITKIGNDGLTLAQQLAPHTPLIALGISAAALLLQAWHNWQMRKITRNEPKPKNSKPWYKRIFAGK